MKSRGKATQKKSITVEEVLKKPARSNLRNINGIMIHIIQGWELGRMGLNVLLSNSLFDNTGFLETRNSLADN